MVKKKKPLRVCKNCKIPAKRVSRKGYCPDCSVALATNAIVQLQTKEGEIYEKWLLKAAAGLQKAAEKVKPSKTKK